MSGSPPAHSVARSPSAAGRRRPYRQKGRWPLALPLAVLWGTLAACGHEALPVERRAVFAPAGSVDSTLVIVIPPPAPAVVPPAPAPPPAALKVPPLRPPRTVLPPPPVGVALPPVPPLARPPREHPGPPGHRRGPGEHPRDPDAKRPERPRDAQRPQGLEERRLAAQRPAPALHGPPPAAPAAPAQHPGCDPRCQVERAQARKGPAGA